MKLRDKDEFYKECKDIVEKHIYSVYEDFVIMDKKTYKEYLELLEKKNILRGQYRDLFMRVEWHLIDKLKEELNKIKSSKKI